jgi:hypothetical protein
MASGWTPEQYEEYAWHVCFEIEALLDQVALLVERFGPTGPQGSDTDTEGEPMLEASLVHLRLLDDFLGPIRKHPEDVHASNWVHGWAGRAFLEPRVRKVIDWQVAHLSTRRVVWADWDLPSYVAACCEALTRFFEEIADADRRDDFIGTRERVREEGPKFT